MGGASAAASAWTGRRALASRVGPGSRVVTWAWDVIGMPPCRGAWLTRPWSCAGGLLTSAARRLRGYADRGTPGGRAAAGGVGGGSRLRLGAAQLVGPGTGQGALAAGLAALGDGRAGQGGDPADGQEPGDQGGHDQAGVAGVAPAVEAQGALVVVDDLAVRGAAGRPPDHVLDLGQGVEHDPPPGPVQPQAGIHLLEVHEVAGVEPADVVKGPAAQQHAGPRDPVDLHRLAAVDPDHVVAAGGGGG